VGSRNAAYLLLDELLLDYHGHGAATAREVLRRQMEFIPNEL
jgi:hypothetical protein